MTNRKLKPANREKSNIEAEKGEVVTTITIAPNTPESYIIDGKKHSQGGTPLNLKEGSFIFSNSKELRIKDKDILKMFEMPENKVGYTPAEIAKKYDLNKYKEILLDPMADEMQRNTATLMINNMMDKLAALALYQESMKGFPQGIPEIAIQYMEKMGIKPEDLFGSTREEQQYIDNEVQPQAYLGMTVDDKDKYNPLYVITGNPIADTVLNTLNNTQDKINNEFAIQNLISGPLQNDKGNFNIKEPETSQSNTQKSINSNNNVTFPGFKINLSLNTALLDSVASIFQRIDEKRAMLKLKNALSGENSATYTTASKGDYVETGTSYGQFRPDQQVYSVNPMNIVTNKRVFDDGGESGNDDDDKIKERVAKTLRANKDDVVIIQDVGDINMDNYDPKKLYVIKDESGKYKIVNYKYNIKDDVLKNVNPDETNEFKKKAQFLIKVAEESEKYLDNKINELTRANNNGQHNDEINKLKILKKGIHTNKLVLNENINNEEFLKKYLSNRFDLGEDKGKIINDLKQKHRNDTDIISNNEVKTFQEIFRKEDDFLKKHGLKRLAYGFDEKGERKSTSPADSVYGDTTAGYMVAPKDIYELKSETADFSTDEKKLPKPPAAPEEKDEKAPFFTQDVLNLSLALKERAGIKKYLPYVKTPEVFLPEATYLSPERQLAANQEAYNKLSNLASMLGTTQSFAATASVLAGQQMQQNANIVGNIHNQNVQIANQYDSMRNQMLSNASAQKANLLTNYYDKTVVANQQFDNAKREAERNIVKAFNQAWTNRGYAQMLNKTSDYFSLDPVTFTINYDKEKATELEPKNKESKDIVNNLSKFNSNLNKLGLPDETKKELLSLYMKQMMSEDTQSNTPKQASNPFLDMFNFR